MSSKQRVLTFRGERWFESRYEDDYNMYAYIVDGYGILNEIINTLVERDDVNAHSVNYSHIFLPQGEDGEVEKNQLLIEYFATVLYTGPDPREIYGSTNERFEETITDTTTLLEVKDFSQIYQPKGT